MATFTQTFTSSGIFLWTAPEGVTEVTAEVWGAGGGGGGQNLASDGGGGGGGGGYSRSTLTVVPLQIYSASVGQSGSGGVGVAGTNGGDTWFSSSLILLAKGGTSGSPSPGIPPSGGLGGQAAAGIGNVKFSGGNGGRGRDSATGRGGPGGSSAGTDANGTSGPNPWTTVTAATPTATDAGIGGNSTDANNGPGLKPASGKGGGGGGASEGTNIRGGDGESGWVRLTWNIQIGAPIMVRWIDDDAY